MNSLNSLPEFNLTDDQMSNRSLHMLRVLAPYTSALLPCALLEFCCGIIIFAAIISAPELRKNQTFVILANIVANDVIFALGTILTCSKRLYHYYNHIPVPTTVRDCFGRDLWRLGAYSNSNRFALLLAIHRLVGVAAPIWFQKPDAHRVFNRLIGVVYVHGIIHGVLMFFMIKDEWQPMPVCGFVPIRNVYSTILSAYAILAVAAIAIIYLAAAITTRVKLNLVKRRHGNLSEAREQLQVRVVRTLGMILLAHLLTATIGNCTSVLLAVTRFGEESDHIAYVAAGYFVTSSTPLCLLILYRRCGEFNESLARICRYFSMNRVSNKVISLQKSVK